MVAKFSANLQSVRRGLPLNNGGTMKPAKSDRESSRAYAPDSRRSTHRHFIYRALRLAPTALVAGGIIVGPLGPVAAGDAATTSTLAPDSQVFVETFDGGDGLITNEYAYIHPRRANATLSAEWQVTSGSLFIRDGAGWTGVPDRESPGPDSEEFTGSAVLRAYPNVEVGDDSVVTMRFRPTTFADDPSAQDWDGIHLLTRYHDEQEFYSVSLIRRDGLVVIKRKLPGGPSNGGTYVTLATARVLLDSNEWHDARVETSGGPDAVRIVLWLDNVRVLEAIDAGELGPPITGPSAIGVWADNFEVAFDDLEIR